MHSTSFSPECILMTGSTENFEGLETALKKRLDIPIRIHETDLVREIENFQDTYDPKWSAPHLNNAVASALAQIYGYRELNFKTNPFGTKTFWRNHKASLIKTGSLAVAVFLIFLMNMLIGNCLMEKRLAQLEGKIESIFRSAFPDTSRIEDAVLQMQIKLREAGGKDTAFPGLQNNIRAIDILNEISKRIPENADVKLDQLILGKESLQFSGNTGNFNTINDIQSRLEPVPFFKKVMISTASVDRSGKQVRFKINADLGNP
jgi:Tfp pilus assembly protein PilN